MPRAAGPCCRTAVMFARDYLGAEQIKGGALERARYAYTEQTREDGEYRPLEEGEGEQAKNASGDGAHGGK